MRDYTKRKIFIPVLCILILTTCRSDEKDDANIIITDPPFTRSFRMGFTPWPYAATQAAVDDTYAKINTSGDIVAHHIDSGIPWQEALDGTAYPPAVTNELNTRESKTAAGKEVYLAISPLDGSRSALAGYWNDSGTGQPLTAPWDGYDFDTPAVQTAYINFATDLINRFNPVYFNFGIEASELAINNPGRFTRFADFAAAVSSALKSAFPQLKLMISVALKTPGSADAQTIAAAIPNLISTVDLVGVSVYPYIFFQHAGRGDPANLPDNWLSQIRDVAGSKPVAVAETGWIAEQLLIPDLIPGYTVDVAATPENQDAYLQELFTRAQGLNAEFIIWFSIVDFDDLWNNALGQSPLAQIWRDTGLYDGTVTPRPALTTWENWLDYTLAR